MREIWVIGVDPGRKGALCLLSSAGDIQFIDMPQTPEECVRVFKLVYRLEPDLVFIEDVHSLFGMSAKSNFQFGGWVKMINTILEMAVHPVESVIERIQPKAWQKEIGIIYAPKTPTKLKKTLASEYALKIEPRLAAHFFGPRGGLLDGRVDAFLIAKVAANRSFIDAE
jgi:hypothetical protein